MKLRTMLWIAAAAWLVTRAVRPKWYDDLMLRAFASDQIAGLPPGADQKARENFEKVADTAAKYALPLGWLLRAAEVGTGESLEGTAKKLKAKVLSMGQPANTEPGTLAAYKSAALAAVGVTT